MGFGTDALSPINYTLWREDVWSSREAALHAHRKMLHGWDPRCVERMTQHGFRDLPTRLYPDVEAVKARLGTTSNSDTDATPVTLTTTKYQDLLGQIRENFSARDPSSGSIRIPRTTHADLDPLAAFIPMYRPEPRSVFLRLSTLRPSCLWVLGGATYLNLDEMREGIKACGTGVGGGGGIAEGRVREVTLPGFGHLMPFQEVKAVMEPCGQWIGEEMERYRSLEREWEESRKGRSHLVLEEQWYKTLRPLGGGKAKNTRKDKL